MYNEMEYVLVHNYTTFADNDVFKHLSRTFRYGSMELAQSNTNE